MILLAMSAVGAALFAWPFIASDAPPASLAFMLALTTVAVLLLVEAATRRLDARRLALLAAIAAIDAALRVVLSIGIAGFSPIFFLILVAGYVYGPSFGFLCGAVSLLASAVATGSIGPWVPYELVGCGWMGAIAGLAGAGRRPVPRRRDVVILAAIAVVTGFAYGALQDIWDWTAFYRGAPDFGYIQGASAGVLLQHFVRFYLATSAVWDSFRAGGDALAVIVLGLPVMSAMARVRSRLSFTIVHERLAEQAT